MYMVILAMVFLIPLASAFEFDNVQVWDDEIEEKKKNDTEVSQGRGFYNESKEDTVRKLIRKTLRK